jgi:RimJ/RimL family protein N-acetyltransferase
MDRIIVLKKEKTALVVPEKKDVEVWTKWINDLEISQFITTYWTVLTKENEEEFYDQMIKHKTSRNFSIYSLLENKVIWNSTLTEISFEKWVAVLWLTIFDKSAQNKWHWTEVMNMLLEFWFNVLWLRKIKLNVFWNNPRAIYVYEKVWFKKVWVLKKEYFRNWKFIDENIMEIFKKDFKN